MAKIINNVLFLRALSMPLFAMELKAEAYPTSLALSWDAVEGAVYYDIYKDNGFVERLDSDRLSSSIGKLRSETEYSISIAARTSDNQTLDAGFAKASTTSWDGIYRWVNTTEHDNKGKLRELVFRVDTEYSPSYGQYCYIYLQINGAEHRIFPLYEFGDEAASRWNKYDDSSPVCEAYRVNAGLFNTSSMTPSKWKVSRIVIDYDSCSAYIQTSALGLNVSTVTSYAFSIEDGEQLVRFSTEGSGIVGSLLFKNPNPGEGDAFILRKTE